MPAMMVVGPVFSISRSARLSSAVPMVTPLLAKFGSKVVELTLAVFAIGSGSVYGNGTA